MIKLTMTVDDDLSVERIVRALRAEDAYGAISCIKHNIYQAVKHGYWNTQELNEEQISIAESILRMINEEIEDLPGLTDY